MSNVHLCDTHCHIHYEYPLAADEVIQGAAEAGVDRIITMASNPNNAIEAVEYARSNDGKDGVLVRACVGVYPQESEYFAADTIDNYRQLIKDSQGIVVGIGEVGLDYFYDYKDRDRQLAILEPQLQLAVDMDLPVSLHVRSGVDGDAFADLFPMLDNFGGKVRGVLHSFTDSISNLERVLTRDLYIGVNGICTFNRDEKLDEVYRAVPLDRVVFETDSPYLAPKPYRGKVNQPAYIRQIAEHFAKMRGVEFSELAGITTKSACNIFDI